MHSNPYGSRRIFGLALVKALLFVFTHLPFVSAAPAYVSLARGASLHDEDGKPPEDPSLWLYLGIATALVLSGGAFAGLTIALMGQVRAFSVPHPRQHRQTSYLTSCLSRMKSTSK